MTRRKRMLLFAGFFLAVAGVAAWRWQSELIGIGTRWYLTYVASREEARGDLTQRRQAVAKVNRLLLLQPAPDAWVPELFDLITAVSSRVATGEIDLDWAAYVYDSYERDLARDRPNGTPRRSMPEIEAAVAEYIRFYTLQKRPDGHGADLHTLTGGEPDESFTVDEIEKATREGRDLTQK